MIKGIALFLCQRIVKGEFFMDGKEKGVGFFDGISNAIKEGVERRKQNSASLIYDALAFFVAFLFARCHVVFGTYPLATAFLAVLPCEVFVALFGALLGSISLGRLGVIYAITSFIVVFLRIMISGGKENKHLFCEPLVLRMSSSAIGAFVNAVYEFLLNGFSLTSVLYGVFGVLLSASFTFLFSGLFDMGIGYDELLFGKKDILTYKKQGNEKYAAYLFSGSALIFIFFISLSMKKYDFFGVSPSYLFAAVITLFTARRFGAMRAMAVGFVSTLGISGLYSVSFALLGVGAGVLFSVNITYALIFGGVLLSLWGFYAGGVVGFLSLFPEYSAAALVSLPFLKKISKGDEPEHVEKQSRDASNMVATTALGYKSSGRENFGELEKAILGLSSALRSFGVEEGRVSLEEYRELVIKCTREFCAQCPRYDVCCTESPAPCVEKMDEIATKIYKKQRLFPDDSTVVPKYCRNSGPLFEKILSECAQLEEERYKDRRMEGYAEECELFSKLLSEARIRCERETAVDNALSEKLTEVFASSGMAGGVIRAYGERHKYFIGAGEDKDGRIITSPELRRGIENAAGVKLGSAEYYRKGDIALFECPTAPMYTVEFATAVSSHGSEVSGDTAVSFESGDGYFYSLISDGMGSGELAHRTSLFTADFLSRILSSSCTKSTAFHLLNHMIRSKGEECSSTVDLFEFDTLSGEAVFFKCGAAPSYVKRDSSIFRIRSETAPLGLMKSIDAEKIRVEVKSGDYIIMLSDGVSQTPEDSIWLLELLGKPPKPDVRDYAEYILEAARVNSKILDDMSVAVARIIKVGEDKKYA